MYRNITLKTLKNGFIRLFAAEIEKNKCVPGAISIAMYDGAPAVVLRMKKSPSKIILFLNTMQVYFYVHGMFRLQKYLPEKFGENWNFGTHLVMAADEGRSIKVLFDERQIIRTELGKIEVSMRAFVLANLSDEVFQSFFTPGCAVQAARVNGVPGYVWVYNDDKPRRFIMLMLNEEGKETQLLRFLESAHPVQIQRKPKMMLHSKFRYFFDGKVIRWRKSLYIQEQQAKEIFAAAKIEGVTLYDNFVAVYAGTQPYWLAGTKFKALLFVDALTGAVKPMKWTANMHPAAPDDKDFFCKKNG